MQDSVDYGKGYKETRPWGEFEVLESGDGYKVKRIMVVPGGRLSLQYHNHRSEYWVIVGGMGIAQIGEEKLNCKQGDSFFVEKETIHRVENSTTDDSCLVIIETQLGSCLLEDDIVRLEDQYGRIT